MCESFICCLIISDVKKSSFEKVKHDFYGLIHGIESRSRWIQVKHRLWMSKSGLILDSISKIDWFYVVDVAHRRWVLFDGLEFDFDDGWFMLVWVWFRRLRPRFVIRMWCWFRWIWSHAFGFDCRIEFGFMFKGRTNV